MAKPKEVFLRTAYNYDLAKASDESGLRCEDVSLTIQSAKDDADINVIVERFGLTGKMPDDIRTPMYGDFTGVSDYRDMLHRVSDAQAEFARLPAATRYRFGNDPAEFVDFCLNADNRLELERMGLAKRAEPSHVDPAAVAANRPQAAPAAGAAPAAPPGSGGAPGGPQGAS